MTASSQPGRTERESGRRLLRIWCVYALLGPLIGAAVGWLELSVGLFFVSMKFSAFPQHSDVGDVFLRANTALSSVPFAALFGLLWGFPFAALTGLAIMVLTSLGKRVRLLDALSIASTIYLVLFAATYAYAYLAGGVADLSALRMTTFHPLVLVRYPQFAILPVFTATATYWSMLRRSSGSDMGHPL